MRYTLKTLVFTLAAIAAAPSAFADDTTASDGTVHITGTIKQNACTVKTSSIDVVLKDEFASVFTAAGQTQGDKAFTIDLENCDASVYPNVQARFEGSTDSYGNNVLQNSNGDASGVGVQILDSTNSAMTFNDESAWSTATVIPDGETDVSLPFTARYIATNSTVSAGSVDTSATFYLQYN